MRYLSMFLSLLVSLPLSSPAQTPPVKLNLVIVEGDGAINNIRQRTAREPVVQVEDENHKPVAGAVVVFLLPNQGTGGTFANGARTLTVVSDDQGRAVARGLRPNSGQGQYQIHVNASFNGQTASTVVTQTNIAGAAAGSGAASAGLSGKVIAILVVVGAAAAGGIAYAATHSGGANNSSAQINSGVNTTTIAAGSATVGPPK